MEKTRAQLAQKSRILPPDHPVIVALKSKYRGEHLHEYVRTDLARDPRPTDEQLTTIAEMLLAARSTATHSMNSSPVSNGG